MNGAHKFPPNTIVSCISQIFPDDLGDDIDDIDCRCCGYVHEWLHPTS